MLCLEKVIITKTLLLKCFGDLLNLVREITTDKHNTINFEVFTSVPFRCLHQFYTEVHNLQNLVGQIHSHFFVLSISTFYQHY